MREKEKEKEKEITQHRNWNLNKWAMNEDGKHVHSDTLNDLSVEGKSEAFIETSSLLASSNEAPVSCDNFNFHRKKKENRPEYEESLITAPQLYWARYFSTTRKKKGSVYNFYLYVYKL